MAKWRKAAANRDATPRRLLLALALTTAGLVGGALLGSFVVGPDSASLADHEASFAALSANPDAIGPDETVQPACIGCADSYGVGARMRAARDDRMDASFRELGVVELDDGLAAPDSDYQYDGREPDPAPITMVSPVALPPAPLTPPTEAAQPAEQPAVPADPVQPPQ